MGSLHTVLRVSAQNFRKWSSNPRFYILGILLLGFFVRIFRPIRTFTEAVTVPATPWALPFMMSDWYINMLVFFGVVLLFCDAPFVDSGQPYLMVRTGRKVWLYGQIGYILSASILYFIVIAIIPSILLFPNLTLQNGWGKVWGTLSQTNAGSQFDIPMSISHALVASYTPLQAMLHTFMLSVLNALMLGLIMFVCNMAANRTAGVMAALFVVFIQAFAKYNINPVLYFFAPTSWAGLTNISVAYNTKPSLLYAYMVLIVLIAALVAAAHFLTSKKDIEVLPPV